MYFLASIFWENCMSRNFWTSSDSRCIFLTNWQKWHLSPRFLSQSDEFTRRGGSVMSAFSMGAEVCT